jgi:hypothetical protein
MVVKKEKNKFEKYFTLTWKRFFVIISVWIVCVLLHNLFYAIFGFEEAVFFIISVFIIPVYFFAAFVYTIVRKVRFRFS